MLMLVEIYQILLLIDLKTDCAVADLFGKLLRSLREPDMVQAPHGW